MDVLPQLTIDGREEQRTGPMAPRTSPAQHAAPGLFDAAPFAQQRGQLAADLEPAGPLPEAGPDPDAYLRCVRCGWSYPLETTAADERCANGECAGTLVYAVGEWERFDA